MLEGKGSFGVVYSNPILPFIKKILFSVYKVDDVIDFDEVKDEVEEVDYIINLDDVADIDIFNEVDDIDYLDELDDVEVDNVEVDNVEVDNVEVDNVEVDDNLCVCKVFIDIENFIEESNSYMYIFENFYLDPQFFNMPICYGEIDHDYVQEHPEIYNQDWADNNLSFMLSQFQITFLKGVIVENSIISNFDKFKNIFYAVKFLNDNSLLYDDLKLDNIIFVNDVYKISDFSSIIHIDDINYKKYNDSKLVSIFYFIYNPILNTMLLIFLSLEEKKNVNYLDLDKELNTEIKTYKSKIYVNYCQQKFRDVISISNELMVKIRVGGYSLNDKFKKIIYTDLYVKDIFIFLDNKTLINNNFKYIEAFYSYYKIKHRNVSDIKKNIMKRINIYSLGMILFSLYLIQPSLKTLELAIMCSLNAFIINDIVYITETNIDEIIENM